MNLRVVVFAAALVVAPGLLSGFAAMACHNKSSSIFAEGKLPIERIEEERITTPQQYRSSRKQARLAAIRHWEKMAQERIGREAFWKMSKHRKKRCRNVKGSGLSASWYCQVSAMICQ